MKKFLIFLMVLAIFVVGGIYARGIFTKVGPGSMGISEPSTDWAIEQVRGNPKAEIFILEMKLRGFSPRVWAQRTPQGDGFIVVIDSGNVKDFAKSFRVNVDGKVTEIVGEMG